MDSKVKKNNLRKKILFIVLGGIFILFLASSIIIYRIVFGNNVSLGNKESTFIYIPTNSGYEAVKQILYKSNILRSQSTFEWVARKKGYPSHVHPGKYLITRGMSNNSLISMLRAGRQVPVKLVFNNIRTKADLASRISHQIEADSVSLLKILSDSQLANSFGLDTENIMVLFIPNTYEMWWNTDAQTFIKKMDKEYHRFWNEAKKEKAKKTELSPADISILASIVEKESNKNDEKPTIAGVYINRLHQGKPLEADPTLVFALGDFTIRRVLNQHKRIESPYNTYKYKGLPPGPICLPSISSINSVLDYSKHNYLYFCAKEDLSGYHNFAASLPQHIANAKRYQQALDRMNIKK